MTRHPLTLLIGFFVVCLMVADLTRRRFQPWPGELSAARNGADGLSPSEQERNASGVALQGATIVIALWLLKLTFIWSADRLMQSLAGWQGTYEVLGLAGFAWVAGCAVWQFWPRQQKFMRRIWLGRLAASGCVLAIVAWLLVNEYGAAALPSPGLFVAAALVFAGASVCVDLTSQTWKAVSDQVTQWRRVPALLGVVAMAFLVAHLAFDSWQPADAILYFDRTTHFGGLASPAVPILMTAFVVYWWACWNVRRVRLLQLPETQVGLGDLLDTRARRAGLDPKRSLREPSLTMGPFILIPLGALIYIACGAGTAASIEGERFAIFLYLASGCLLSIMAHTLAHSIALARAVRSLLASLARHPSIEIMQILAKQPFSWRLAYTETHRFALEPLTRRIEQIDAGWSGWTWRDARQIAAITAFLEGSHWFADTRRNLARAAESLRYDKATCMTRQVLGLEDWRALDILVTNFCEILRLTKWSPKFAYPSLSAGARQSLDDMDFVVFFHAAIVLRDLLTRLVSGFTAAFGGLLLLLAAHLLYTFQGRVFWLSLDAVAIAFTAGWAIHALQGLERDAVLSSLWGTTAGRISLFGKMSWRLAAYVLIALLTLLGTFFPELGGRFVNWIEPTRKLFAL